MLDLRDSHKLEELVNSATDEGEDTCFSISKQIVSFAICDLRRKQRPIRPQARLPPPAPSA